MKDSIKNALSWRYAVAEFDQKKPLSDDIFTTILESGRLAPSSNGFEPWKFIVVDNPAVRLQIRAAAFDQPKVTEAAKLVVVAYRTDPDTVITEIVERTAQAQGKTPQDIEAYRGYLAGAAAGEHDIERYFEKQTYIALGFMLQTAALLGVDAGPMSGFVPTKVDQILGLPEQNLKSTTLLALGYRAAEPARAKLRQSAEEAIITIA